MKDLNNKTFGRFSVVLMIFFIMGCASEPINVELSTKNPANSEAQETEFVPPPNPFQEDVGAMPMESKPESMMKHTPHKENGQQHMNHQMGTDKKSHSDSELKMKPEEAEGHYQHQEHSQ